MKNYVGSQNLIAVAWASALLALLSIFALPFVIVILVILVSIMGLVLFGDENKNLWSAIIGSIPTWTAIFLYSEFENVPQAVIRIYVIGVLFVIGVAALVKLWIQRLQEQKEIELANQREKELRLQMQDKERNEQELKQSIDESIQD